MRHQSSIIIIHYPDVYRYMKMEESLNNFYGWGVEIDPSSALSFFKSSLYTIIVQSSMEKLRWVRTSGPILLVNPSNLAKIFFASLVENERNITWLSETIVDWCWWCETLNWYVASIAFLLIKLKAKIKWRKRKWGFQFMDSSWDVYGPRVIQCGVNMEGRISFGLTK